MSSPAPPRRRRSSGSFRLPCEPVEPWRRPTGQARPQRYPHSPSPSRASVIGRQRAHQLAPTDTAKALEAARGCPDAWDRVQALAAGAEHAEPHALAKLLEEAVREAQSCHDAYGRIAVIGWVLGAAFLRQQYA